MKLIKECVGRHYKTRAIMDLFECPKCLRHFVGVRGDVKKSKSCGCIKNQRVFKDRSKLGRPRPEFSNLNSPVVKYRLDLGLTSGQLATKLKVSRLTIYNLENNKYKNFSSIFKTFGTSLPVEVLDDIKKIYTKEEPKAVELASFVLYRGI